MGNRPSGQSEEEATAHPPPAEALRPSRSCSVEVGLVDHNQGEEAEEVELPPPMKPISEQLLAATASAKGDDSHAKRVN